MPIRRLLTKAFPQLGDLCSQVWRRSAVDVPVGAGVVFLAVNESGQGI